MHDTRRRLCTQLSLGMRVGSNIILLLLSLATLSSAGVLSIHTFTPIRVLRLFMKHEERQQRNTPEKPAKPITRTHRRPFLALPPFPLFIAGPHLFRVSLQSHMILFVFFCTNYRDNPRPVVDIRVTSPSIEPSSRPSSRWQTDVCWTTRSCGAASNAADPASGC